MMKKLITKQEVEGTSHHPLPNTQHARGISLISLIITIIVIIILAAIVIFTGLNTPDRANFAKFVSEFSDFRTAITQDFMNKKAEYAISGKTRSDAQIYYIIANNIGPDDITDINVQPSDNSTSGQYHNVYTLEDLGVAGLGIQGTYAFLISDDKNVKGWNKNTKYYEPNETHYVTDEGDVFILKGYRVEQNGSDKWFLNETVSSDREIKGKIAIQPGNVTITTDSNGDSPAGTNLNKTTVAKLYIQMSPTVEGGSVTIKEKETGNTVTMPYEVTKNGTYQFTLTTTVEGVSDKDITVEVNNWAVPTVASVGIEVGDYVNYAGDSSYTLKQSETGINDSEATTEGYTNGEKPISAVNATWRVWKVNKDEDDNISSIVIMPTTPVNEFRLRGVAGFTNSVDIIEAVCDMYKNDSLGITAGDVRSLKIEDLEDTRVSSNLASIRDNYANSNASTGKYGGTKNYTSGTFYTEEDGVTINKSGRAAPATVTQTYYYTDSPSWNSCGNTKPGLTSTTYSYLLGSTYGWLASPCVYLDSSNANFGVRFASPSFVYAYSLVYSGGGTGNRSGGVRPLVTLRSTLPISGGSGTEGAPWILGD